MKPVTIMVVEDETVIAMNIEKLLERLGYKVIARTATGEDAVRMADDLHPDLILMDIVLAGGMDGIEAAKIIRNKHNTPVIYLTGNADTLTINRARETDPFGYVLKPFTINHLFSTIDTAIHRSELEARLSEKSEELERANEELQSANEEMEEVNEDLRIANEELFQAHETIHESEAHLLATIESLPFDFFTLDTSEHYVMQNSICRKHWGDIRGKHPEEIAPDKETLTLWHNNNRRALAGDMVQEETQFKVIDEIRDYYNIISPITDRGAILGILGINIDITERKSVEKALQESEEKYRALVENSLFGIGIVEGITVHYANNAAMAMFGYDNFGDFSSADLVGPLPPHSKTFLEEWRRKKARGEEVPMVFEFDIIRKDGDSRTLQINLSYMHIMDKTYAYATFIDVTERKQAEHALKESEEKLKMIIDHSNELFYIHDIHHKLLYVSPQSEQMLGYAPDELLIEWPKLATENPINAIGIEITDTAIKTGKIQKPYELELYRKDGGRVLLEIHESPILDKEGKVVAITGAARDITERKHAVEQIRTALREKEVLLKEIHHRVKNNFQIISSLIDIQLQSIDDSRLSEKFKDTGNRIRAMAIIHEKLYQTSNYSRIELRDFIYDISGELINGYKTEGVHIAFSLDADEVTLTIDQAIPCGLIINEIITNSLKHAFPPGWKGKPGIKVSLHDKGGDIELTVADNGSGIPSGINTNTPQTFGLTLVPMLVNQIGGKMKMHKKKGTKFIVTFRKK